MTGGGAAPAHKADELVPHPVKDQLPNVAYCLTSPPPWPEAILLGFQHYLVFLGNTILIPSALFPQMGGGFKEKARVVIQTLQFVAGLNVLPQTFFWNSSACHYWRFIHLFRPHNLNNPGRAIQRHCESSR